jgi:PAS domain S-box-containing protein
MVDIVHGIPVQDLIGKNCWEIVHKTAEPNVECPFVAVKKTLTRHTTEVHEGDTWFEITADPILDDSGAFAGAVHIMRDITERKRMEESLWQSHQILQSVLDTIPVRVFWKDRDLKYLGCNRPFAQDAGFNEPKDLIGKDDYAMGWKDQAEIYRSDDRSVIASGKAKVMIEEPQTTPDGRIIWLLTSKVPLRDAAGEISGVLGTYMDISEYRHAKEAIRESEEKYKTFFATSKDCVFITSNDGRFEDFNDESPAFFGYRDREEFGMVRVQDLYSNAGDRKEHIRAIEQSGFVKDYPVDLRKKDGSIIHALVISVVRKDISGKVIGFQGTIKDITKQKQAEEALRVSEERFRGITERISDLILIVDPEGYISFVSSSITSILGFSPELLIGKRAGPDIIHADDVAKIWQAERKVKNGSPGEHVEFRMPKNDGSYAVFDGMGIPVFTHGIYAGVQVVARDITERKRAEEALRVSEGKYRLFTEKSNDIIYSMDPSGNFTYVSPQVSRYGYTPEEIISGGLSSLILAEDLPKVLEDTHITISTGKSTASIFRVRDKSGAIVWLEDNDTSVYDSSGKVIAVFGIIRDITERKRAEEALKESNERYISYIKEAAMRLKTPVEVVEGNVNGIIKDINTGDIDNSQVLLQLRIQVKYMEQIRQNIIDLNKTIVEGYGEISPASKKFLTE